MEDNKIEIYLEKALMFDNKNLMQEFKQLLAKERDIKPDDPTLISDWIPWGVGTMIDLLARVHIKYLKSGDIIITHSIKDGMRYCMIIETSNFICAEHPNSSETTPLGKLSYLPHYYDLAEIYRPNNPENALSLMKEFIAHSKHGYIELKNKLIKDNFRLICSPQKIYTQSEIRDILGDQTMVIID